MTTKQIIFIEEYLKDLNATNAAIRSGYSPNSAYSIGSENLKKPEVKLLLLESIQDRSSRTNITSDQVIQALAGMAFSCITDFIEFKNGELRFKDSSQIPAYKAHGLKLICYKNGTVSMNMECKLAALKMLGRHLGMWK